MATFRINSQILYVDSDTQYAFTYKREGCKRLLQGFTNTRIILSGLAKAFVKIAKIIICCCIRAFFELIKFISKFVITFVFIEPLARVILYSRGRVGVSRKTQARCELVRRAGAEPSRSKSSIFYHKLLGNPACLVDVRLTGRIRNGLNNVWQSITRTPAVGVD